MYGATIPPILAKNDPTPKPIFRTTVGNCSAVYTYTAPYEAVMASLATIAKNITNHVFARSKYYLLVNCFELIIV